MSYFSHKKESSNVAKQNKFSPRSAAAAKALVLAVGLTMASAPAAWAATGAESTPAPAVSFSFAQPTIDSGAHPSVSYNGTDLPAGSEIYLQLAYGSPTQWDFLKPLNGASGTATLQSLPAGMYQFRAVAEQGVTVVAVSPVHFLSVVQPSSSTCDACAILGGVGGAIVTWILTLIPW